MLFNIYQIFSVRFMMQAKPENTVYRNKYECCRHCTTVLEFGPCTHKALQEQVNCAIEKAILQVYSKHFM